MSKKQYIFLDAVSKFLNESGEEKIKEFNNSRDEENEPISGNGKPRSWFENMNLPIPQDILDKEKLMNEEYELTLTPEDYEFELDDSILDIDCIEFIVDTEDGGKIFTKAGNFITVDQLTDEIYAQIHYVQRNWRERTIDNIIQFFRTIKLLITSKKEANTQK